MRNPLKRQPTADPKPTLRERAASLKATAGRVMSATKPGPKAAPDVPDARAFALKQTAVLDLSGLSIMQLGVLFDRFDAASNMWNAELHLPYANDSKGDFRLNTAAGELLEREQERVAEIRDRIAAEIDRRQPANERDANTQLETLIRHELMCNGDLRDPAIRARIEATWGAAAAPEATTESAVLLADINPSAMPMRVLDALNDHAETLASVCHGLAAQPRSLRPDGCPNEAGAVMYRLAEDLLPIVMDACQREVRRRDRATGDDRDIRIAMLARPTLANGDSDEIRAFARDLVTIAEG